MKGILAMCRFLYSTIGLRRADVREVWVLRIAGIWLVCWLHIPVMLSGQVRRYDNIPTQNEMATIQRVQILEGRVAAIEFLRLDARLALLEDTRADVKMMRQSVETTKRSLAWCPSLAS